MVALIRRTPGSEEAEYSAPITIFYGGNGSGKTTLLNIIAEKTKVTRHSTFSGGAFFQKYVTGCEITGRTIPANSQILTSDDVFDYLLNIRYLNDGIDVRREELFEEYMEYKIATSSEEKSSGGSGVGCNPTLIFGILVVLWLLSKLSS